MTPKQLIAELNAVCGMAAPHFRDGNQGAIAKKVYELGPQILSALRHMEAVEGAKVALKTIVADHCDARLVAADALKQMEALKQ